MQSIGGYWTWSLGLWFSSIQSLNNKNHTIIEIFYKGNFSCINKKPKFHQSKQKKNMRNQTKDFFFTYSIRFITFIQYFTNCILSGQNSLNASRYFITMWITSMVIGPWLIHINNVRKHKGFMLKFRLKLNCYKKKKKKQIGENEFLGFFYF